MELLAALWDWGPLNVAAVLVGAAAGVGALRFLLKLAGRLASVGCAGLLILSVAAAWAYLH